MNELAGSPLRESPVVIAIIKTLPTYFSIDTKIIKPPSRIDIVF
jgi:hypothetical protein